jgi:hypothetical protein
VATRREPELPPPPPPAPRPKPATSAGPVSGATPTSPAASAQEVPTHTATDAVSGTSPNGAVSSDKPATGGKD